jgi:hypothetical protein
MDLASLCKGQYNLAEAVQGTPRGKDKGASQWEGGFRNGNEGVGIGEGGIMDGYNRARITKDTREYANKTSKA